MTPDPQLQQRAEEWLNGLEEHYTQNKIDRLIAFAQRERLMAKISELKDVEEVYRAGVSVTSYVSNRLTVLNAQLSRDGGETNDLA